MFHASRQPDSNARLRKTPAGLSSPLLRPSTAMTCLPPGPLLVEQLCHVLGAGLRPAVMLEDLLAVDPDRDLVVRGDGAGPRNPPAG